MDLFMIDTNPDTELLNKELESENESEDQETGKFVRSFRLDKESDSEDEKQKEPGKFVRSFVIEEQEELKEDGGQFSKDAEEENYDYCGIPSPSHDITEYLQETLNIIQSKREAEQKRKQKDDDIDFDFDYYEKISSDTSRRDQIAKEKFLTTGIEMMKDLRSLGISNNERKRNNKKEREKTKGDKWFNLPAPEMTDELKNELEIIKMRNSLDPKRFYKRSENKNLPKYFEIGKVVESPLDYHNSKNVRKTKAKTLVDELMEDVDFQKFQKKKFKESQEFKKNSTFNKALKKMKKLKKQRK